MELRVRPLTTELWPALEDLFEAGSACRRCWYMYWRMGSAYRQQSANLDKAAFYKTVQTGPPPGLLALDGETAVGWCQLTARDCPDDHASCVQEGERGFVIRKSMKTFAVVAALICLPLVIQTRETKGDPIPQFVDLLKGHKLSEWINVNTAADTWHFEKDVLVCSGHPIGVMRSTKQYENFVLHVEWMHMEAGGNSGVFAWSDAHPDPKTRLPNGVEIQMLELDWVNLNKQNGEPAPLAYVHGELFGVGGVKTVPDNPRGERSKSVENRCKGRGEWNVYDVVAVDGSIKLSVNGKVVNGISHSTQKKGYLCLESEGGKIRFRNMKVMELPPGVTTPEQAAPVL